MVEVRAAAPSEERMWVGVRRLRVGWDGMGFGAAGEVS
jgi:hypothetical protein